MLCRVVRALCALGGVVRALCALLCPSALTLARPPFPLERRRREEHGGTGGLKGKGLVEVTQEEAWRNYGKELATATATGCHCH